MTTSPGAEENGSEGALHFEIKKHLKAPSDSGGGAG